MTSTAVSTYNFNTSSIRVLGLDGNPWFVAADVCRVLGIIKTDRATRALSADEKGTQQMSTPGGRQSMSTISESGLYKLVMRSDKPQAK